MDIASVIVFSGYGPDMYNAFLRTVLLLLLAFPKSRVNSETNVRRIAVGVRCTWGITELLYPSSSPGQEKTQVRLPGTTKQVSENRLSVAWWVSEITPVVLCVRMKMPTG